MTALPRITPAQRRSRLVRRHLLAPARRKETAEAVAEALIGLHATDPATVYLTAAARMHTPTAAAIDHSLYHAPNGAPGLERIRCMRRTMFVVPAHLAPAVQSATVRDIPRQRASTTAQLGPTPRRPPQPPPPDRARQRGPHRPRNRNRPHPRLPRRHPRHPLLPHPLERSLTT
ncbi:MULTISPECIES: crosslink repair DNA glycosylase YcaQ family protein [unclassified Streptomyces]|uniref:DNA glycosylase AlkZ-like family protein n=1 Tax=unclassified Streptomyces TaxID=2593676 RepID=UPI0003A710E0|nr:MULTISPECIES: crosslink repair DNA glycosylase YcaQ family protein [unclassified Streptomyces]MYT33148.1 hypothetical protein [Streptomyces sp. SID8354]